MVLRINHQQSTANMKLAAADLPVLQQHTVVEDPDGGVGGKMAVRNRLMEISVTKHDALMMVYHRLIDGQSSLVLWQPTVEIVPTCPNGT